MQGSGNLALNNSAAAAVTLSVGGNNASTTFSGGLSGIGSLTKIGAGMLTVTGMNSYSGSTLVNGGTLQILGGQLSTTNESVGIGRSASLVQAGGTQSVASLAIGIVAFGSLGTYSLGGGLLNVAGTESIGQGGDGSFPSLQAAGRFKQTDGTHSVTSLVIGGEGQLSSSGNGSYTLDGGLLTVTGSELIGQGGGIAASPPTSVGSFTQTGGTHSAASLALGVNGQMGFSGVGSYSLSGGLLTVTGTEWIGQGGSFSVGSFTQTGGTNAVSGRLVLAQSAFTTGTYNLNGGLLILSGAAGLVEGSGAAPFNFGGGTLQMGAGFTTSLPIALSIIGSNGTLDTAGNTLTLTNALSGPGGLNKAGAGVLTLAGSYAYTGPTAVSGGILSLSSDIPSSSSFAANNGGTLLFNAATINLTTRSITALAGGNVQYQNATINGGYMRGPGMHTLPSGFGSTLNNTTINPATVVQQAGTDTFTNVTNRGQVTNDGYLTIAGGINDGGSSLSVNGTADVSEWISAGLITINNGGALNNHLSDLTSYGGGRIYINSGGVLDADSQNEGVALNLQDSLLVNDGTVTGTTNVYYGATVSGSGAFGPINVNQGGAAGHRFQRQPLDAGTRGFQRQHHRSGAIGRGRDAGRRHDHDAQPDRQVEPFRRSHRCWTAHQERRGIPDPQWRQQLFQWNECRGWNARNCDGRFASRRVELNRWRRRDVDLRSFGSWLTGYELGDCCRAGTGDVGPVDRRGGTVGDVPQAALTVESR